MAIPFSIVDTSPPGGPGRPEAAGVVLHRAAEAEGWMAGIAAFLRLPVTAFAWPAPGGYRVRAYAPSTELEFSGTAVVAVAHALWRAGLVASTDPVPQLTASGPVEAVRVSAAVEVRRDGRVLFTAALPRTVARGELTWPP